MSNTKPPSFYALRHCGLDPQSQKKSMGLRVMPAMTCVIALKAVWYNISYSSLNLHFIIRDIMRTEAFHPLPVHYIDQAFAG